MTFHRGLNVPFLKANDVEHLSVYLFAHMFILLSGMSMSFAHFVMGLFALLSLGFEIS